MKIKKFILHFAEGILIAALFFGVIELTTRTLSWMGGKGFTLALHEYQAYDTPIENIYQWPPFAGFIFKSNIKFLASHPNQKKKSEISIDCNGFLSNDQNVKYQNGYTKNPVFFMRYLNQSMFYVRIRNKYRDFKQKSDLLKLIKNEIDGKFRVSEIPEEAGRTFNQHIRTLAAIAAAGGAKVILSSFATLHDPKLEYNDEETINRLSSFEKEALGSLMYFTLGLKLPAIFNGISQYNEILKSIAQEKKIGWVDNASLIPNEEKFFVDHVHFSNEGAKLMAQNFLPVVLSYLN